MFKRIRAKEDLSLVFEILDLCRFQRAFAMINMLWKEMTWFKKLEMKSRGYWKYFLKFGCCFEEECLHLCNNLDRSAMNLALEGRNFKRRLNDAHFNPYVRTWWPGFANRHCFIAQTRSIATFRLVILNIAMWIFHCFYWALEIRHVIVGSYRLELKIEAIASRSVQLIKFIHEV